MTREQVSYIGIILALLGSVGGWLVTLNTFADALTPQAIGGLMMILGGGAGGVLIKAPAGIHNLPRTGTGNGGK